MAKQRSIVFFKMKKRYYKPVTDIVNLSQNCAIICASNEGVEGTATIQTCVSDEETDDYLSRCNYNVWDDE